MLNNAGASDVVVIPKAASLPSTFIDGTKTNIGSTAAQLQVTSQVISKGIMIRIDNLGGGTYIKFGNSTSQSIIFNTVGQFYYIDLIDNINKIYVITDGTNAAISWNGG